MLKTVEAIDLLFSGPSNQELLHLIFLVNNYLTVPIFLCLDFFLANQAKRCYPEANF